MRRSTPVVIVILAALLVLPAAATARTSVVSGRVVNRPAVHGGQLRIPLLVTAGSRPRLTALVLPRSLRGRALKLRLGDRLRGRPHHWFRVSRRANAPSFARLDALLSGTRTSASSATGDLKRVAALPPGPVNASNPDKSVVAQRDDVEGLDRRLTIFDNNLADLRPALDSAIAAVRSAYSGRAARFRSLRRSRDVRIAELTAVRDAGQRARPAIGDATYLLESRLAVWQSSGAQIPLSTLGTVSDVTSLVYKVLTGLLP